MLERLWGPWNFRRIEECRTLIEWLGPRPGELILDVGCGPGLNDVAIARSGARVVGIDINTRHVTLARWAKGAGRTWFLVMDAQDMGFRGGSFDKVVSFCAIEHFERDEDVLRHVHRLLREDGLFVLSADSLSNTEIRDAEREAHRSRYAVNRFYTIPVMRRTLMDAGFAVERARYILTTPLTLALVRLSWRLDDLPPRLLPVKILGYVLLGTAGKLASDVTELIWGRSDSGLTLLVRARKRRTGSSARTRLPAAPVASLEPTFRNS